VAVDKAACEAITGSDLSDATACQAIQKVDSSGPACTYSSGMLPLCALQNTLLTKAWDDPTILTDSFPCIVNYNILPEKMSTTMN
jgi:hypothetical protein